MGDVQRAAAVIEDARGRRDDAVTVEDDTQKWLCRIIPAEAPRELRIVGEDRAAAYDDGVVRLAEGEALLARRRGGDPLRVALDRGHLAVEGHPRLHPHERPPPGPALAHNPVDLPA